MAVVCIVYDLHKPGQRWAEMDKAIEAICDDGGRAFDTTWFLNTTMTPEAVYDKIEHVADANDSLMVFKATSPAVWAGLSSEWSAWIKKNL